MAERVYHYSETFYSMQGEGHYTGRPTLWLRYFLCNLQCNGFGQLDPKNPETYFLPYQEIYNNLSFLYLILHDVFLHRIKLHFYSQVNIVLFQKNY